MADLVVVANPVIKEDEGREKLRQMAIAADAAGDSMMEDSSTDDSLASRAARADAGNGEPPVKPDNAGTSTEPARDEQGRFTKADGTKSEPNEAAPKAVAAATATTTAVEPTESDFAKAKKDAERKDRSWKALDEEKRLIREEAERNARDRREWEAQRNAPKKPESATFTSQHYDNFADKAEKDAEEARLRGDDTEAARLSLLALKARKASSGLKDSEQKAEFETKGAEFQKTWTDHMVAQIKEDPEAGKPDTPISKAIKTLFESEQIFSWMPDGFRKAYTIAKWQVDAAEVPALREQIKQLTAENQQYKEKTSLEGGGPIQPSSTPTFDQMSSDQKREYIRRNAARMDGIAA